MVGLKNSKLELDKIRTVATGPGNRIEWRALKEGDKIPTISDSMFKMMFQREEYIKFPCKLLSNIIDLSYEELLHHLSFEKTETGKEDASNYEYRCDLIASVNDSKIIIEMNNNKTEKIRERNISYMMRVREDRREKYDYHQIILVNLNNYCYQGDDAVRRDYAFLDHEGYLYSRNLIIVDIYLPNIKKKCYTKGIDALNEMERFLLIGMEQNIKSALEYAGDDIVMKDFIEENALKSHDDLLRESYDKEEALKEQFYLDGKEEGYEDGKKDGYLDGKMEGIKDGREEGLKEGLEQGIEQGIEQSKLEMAKKMLEENIDISLISKITSLAEEKIKSLDV